MINYGRINLSLLTIAASLTITDVLYDCCELIGYCFGHVLELIYIHLSSFLLDYICIGIKNMDICSTFTCNIFHKKPEWILNIKHKRDGFDGNMSSN